MKRTISRIFLLLLFLIPFGRFAASAQDITGIWRGYFVTEGFDQYKFELQVKQNGSSVSGVSYSYLNTVFYGKATLTGSYNKNGQNALIREIKTVELKMSGGSAACIMKCIFKYERSGKEEFLEGTFTSRYEKDGIINKRGENCGGGKVFLRKVTTSDFYVEPFLRGKIKTKPVIINQAPNRRDTVKTKVTTPIKKTIVVNKPPVKQPIAQKPIVKINPPVTKTNDTLAKITTPPITKTNPPVITPKPDVLKNRTNELVKTLTVTNPDVTVKLYDNGEIDGDTISVYLDNKLVLSSKMLTASPLIVKLKMDKENTEHELVMVAENLGRIPPNTSLMIVESGDKRFDVRITSTEQKNAVVKFKYQPLNLP